ncbi:MAG: SDR family oxidoreductase [Actinomycetota bacterium]|nr:SDR family oxidoreductase [Actinomycetota bacterium]
MTRRVLVTGGAGFVGSHLCRTLLARGDEVVAVDDCSTGSRGNVADLEGRTEFTFVAHDVTGPLPVDGSLDAVCHLASAASPADYLSRPLETLLAGSEGTRHTLELARAKDARYLLASTSEVYGDPLVHPQPETYWGNVNPVGPRSVYDEAKRFAEALATAHRRVHGQDVKIARIFNTYGPWLRPGDGRVVSNFVVQALAGKPLTVYGDGSQTRSFCYVDDQVAGLCALLDSDWDGGPVNIGNPDEHTVLELAKLVIEMTGSGSDITFEPLPQDDPTRRRPDIALAERVLGWRPLVPLPEGLARTVEWFRHAAYDLSAPPAGKK